MPTTPTIDIAVRTMLVHGVAGIAVSIGEGPPDPALEHEIFLEPEKALELARAIEAKALAILRSTYGCQL